MDLKALNKLVGDIQTQHNAKLALGKELHSGQIELENLIRKRETIADSIKASDLNRLSNELVLRVAKFFFASRVLSVPVAPRDVARKSSPSPGRTRSPKVVKSFLCGLSQSPPRRRTQDTTPKPPASENVLSSARTDATSELLNIKKEADSLLHNYYIKYAS